MVKITTELSGGQLNEISILDLTAFGSKIAHFDKHQKQDPDWPTEINFGVLQSSKNVSLVSTKYKKLLDDWRNYMDAISSHDSEPKFTSEMESSTFLNFTSYIKSDMLTFLTAISGSFLTSSAEVPSIWSKIAKKVFKHTKSDDYVRKNGHFDKLMVDCAFKTDLQKKKYSSSDFDFN